MRIVIETGNRKPLAKAAASDWAAAKGGMSSNVEPGLIARIAQGIKYMVSGVTPATWFGPQQPITPISQESKGRLWDYPIGYNLQIAKRPYERVPFEEMRALADSYDLLRLIIETRKDQLAKMEWHIKPRAIGGKKADKKTISQLSSPIKAVSDFLTYPDREHDWDTWLRMLLEDLFVIDAPTIYPRRNKGGGLYSLDMMDGATIIRKINEDGRTPTGTDVAYQQIIKGVPMADFNCDELIYKPRNQRTWKAFGFSPVEQIIMTVNIALRRQLYQLAYYTEGNVPEALISVPESWTTDQIALYQAYWDDMMEGNLAQRRHLKFVPPGMKLIDAKEHAITDKYDEWLARICCFAFAINPQPFVQQMNRATAETIQEASLQEGLYPYLKYVRNVMNFIVWKYFQVPELEFDWEEEEEISPEAQAEVNDTRLRAGVINIDEWRDRDGLDPLLDGQGEEYLIYTAQGAVKIADIINPPEPTADPAAAPGKGGAPDPSSPPPGPEGAQKLAKRKKKLNRIDRERKSVMEARAKLQKIMRKAFRMGKKEAMKMVTDQLTKDVTEAEQHAKRILQHLDLEGWAFLVNPTQELLDEIAKDGTYQALLQIGLGEEDMTNTMSELAFNYAKDRAAELVGKKWVKGELIDNPNAKWQITESTRDFLRADVTQAIEEGWSAGKLKNAISENYAFSDSRAEMIARTEIGNADIQGNMIAYRESGVVSGKEWILGSEHDNDDECDENQDAGAIPLDEAFPSGDMEPLAHPNCLVGDTVVSALGVSKAFKRWFDGEVITLSITGADKLTVTPNHPILTRQGWIAARNLYKGQEVANCLSPEPFIGLNNPQNQYVKAFIENIADSLIVSGGMTASTMKITAEDFHGDGVPDGKVHIIRANSFLNNKGAWPDRSGKSWVGNCREEIALTFRKARRLVFNTLCSVAELLKGVFHSPYSSLSSFRSLCTSIGTGSLRFDDMRLARIPDSQTKRMKTISERGAMTTDSLADIDRRFSGQIGFVKLQDVSITKFSGHVYNLQTEDGYYLTHNGNGVNLFVHNCVCDVMPVLMEAGE